MFAIFGASFAETIIVPIPIEVVLLPFMIARKRQVWWIAATVTAGCLLAAVLGYGVGYYFLGSLGQWLIDTLGAGEDYQRFQDIFTEQGFLAIVAVGVTPIPFQIAMLVAGAAKYPLPLFVLAATLARGIRYFGLALLVVLVGDQAQDFWKRHKKTSALIAVVVMALLFLGLSLLRGG